MVRGGFATDGKGATFKHFMESFEELLLFVMPANNLKVTSAGIQKALK